MMDLESKNSMRGMMKSDYNDNKMDKSSELNSSMTIKESSQDEYTRKLHTLGGSENA